MVIKKGGYIYGCCNVMLTASDIMRDPIKINGRLLPYFEEHLSLQMPTQG